MATFKVEKTGINKSVAHIIINKNREVLDVTASCISMLGIDLDQLQKKRAKFEISTLMPSLFSANNFRYTNKAGDTIEYFYP